MADDNRNVFNLSDKENLGELKQFKALIIFAHDNGVGRSGAGVIGDPDGLRNIQTTIIQAFKHNPALRNLFAQCVNEASTIKLF